jgi:hypothetical protein
MLMPYAGRFCGREGEILRFLRDIIFLVLFLVLLVSWLLAWATYHVAGGLIHLLLIFAVISLVVHLFQGRRTV